MEYYLRGQIARLSNVNVETLRYYEKIKLIPKPTRDENGYRLYSKDVLLLLDFIKCAKNSGFTLEQIGTLFSAGNVNINLDYIDELLNLKLDEIGERITQLQTMQVELNKIKKKLHTPHECPIFNSFLKG